MHEKHKGFKEVKEHADFLMKQLAGGDYKSLDIYSNNLIHLTRTFREFGLYTSDIEFLAWLQKNDPVLLKETVMTGKLILIIANFLRLVSLDDK
ncbi:hypothetical protein GRAQ_01755 [Rahnella aquatilis CIP 78.65 = ATCC 33071]|uniref:Uncharacterized protein n=1 Tax=Rahnella aquatilis (strain ATCC 33071 / DSM 4594 / JCM 1683 / NBRC 105701 / NCIMB 13365 / CIP 78.65) TaxID=745277 RepID=H2IRP7_RAHAC|nr:hypothetical protein [Rahnella aquatilis]AEX52548.1 hypothetical protein Rahaq2_2711 [Rahnella aquatilis CIP 78.65 = ATCC 33071]KFD06271.1 hypothetical protein GRAQ_01755 [Rahnella aquatilis CIP 78.65 = ATCC 33071]